ncbi:hypothetical protein ABID59_001132 [Bradyrhizobium sp. S3.3.6]|uniref:hypothetical protein n=1 Tax=Bradyrhizobium sp. S3.3.6 TaxID=3156429 RepID=UPI0033987B12
MSVGRNARVAKWILVLSTLVLTIPSAAKAQSSYLCDIVAAIEVIKCYGQGEVPEIAQYDLPGLSAVLVTRELENSLPDKLSTLEDYREAAETFRRSSLELFRRSIEDFRANAEEERKAGHQHLYEALIDVYGRMFDFYRDGMTSYRTRVQKYRDSIYRIIVP